jgi:hypothetical protein
MEDVQVEDAKRSAVSDASVGTECAAVDAATDPSADKAQRILDDLVEWDRLLADDRLLKFRTSVDRSLAHDVLCRMLVLSNAILRIMAKRSSAKEPIPF